MNLAYKLPEALTKRCEQIVTAADYTSHTNKAKFVAAAGAAALSVVILMLVHTSGCVE